MQELPLISALFVCAICGQDLSCVKCGNKILHDGLTDIIYWQVSMPQPQAK